MKKLFAALAFVVLLGGGCVGGEKAPEVVTGDWYLAFDLPEGWVMIPNYDDGDAAVTSEAVTKETADIALQSTSKTIVFDAEAPEGVEVETGVATKIVVYRLSSRRSIPDEVEDLGGGFFEQHFECPSGAECDPRTSFSTYYYVGTVDKYQFKVSATHNNNETSAQAESVILSAKEVTQFNQ